MRQEFSLCFRARPIGGTPRTNSESKEIHWVAPTDISSRNVGHANRLRIEHGLQQRAKPYVG
ncbi:NUDIX hydrolase [Saccharopolyspora sp. NPDC000995]